MYYHGADQICIVIKITDAADDGSRMIVVDGEEKRIIPPDEEVTISTDPEGITVDFDE